MKRTIELGCLSPSISYQLKGVFSDKKLEVFDRHAKAIDRLLIFGLLTDTEATSARKRLIKTIQRELNLLPVNQKTKS